MNEADSFNDDDNNDEYFDFDDTDEKPEGEVNDDYNIGLQDLDIDDI